MSEPHRMRLRNGIRTVNGITGETEPTYGEYVLASDFDALAARLAEAEAELKAWQGDAQTYHKRAWDAEKRLAEAEAALRHYADDRNWRWCKEHYEGGFDGTAVARAYFAPDSAPAVDPDKFVADMLAASKCCVCGGPFHGVSRCPIFTSTDQPCECPVEGHNAYCPNDRLIKASKSGEAK